MQKFKFNKVVFIYMLMINIPRRKIYETMLEYEDALLDIQILILNADNFKQYHNLYKNSIQKTAVEYKNIKSLLILFFENKQFQIQKEFEDELDYYMKNEGIVNESLQKQKNIPKAFKQVVLRLDKVFEEIQSIDTFEIGKEIFPDLDLFNSYIPKILEIRRERIQ